MENEKYLPVRRIKPDKNFLHKSEGGGGGPKWFISEEEYEPHKAFLVSALEFFRIHANLSSARTFSISGFNSGSLFFAVFQTTFRSTPK